MNYNTDDHIVKKTIIRTNQCLQMKQNVSRQNMDKRSRCFSIFDNRVSFSFLFIFFRAFNFPQDKSSFFPYNRRLASLNSHLHFKNVYYF